MLIKLTKIKDKESIKSSYGKATDRIQGNPDKGYWQIFQQTLYRPERHDIFTVMKGKNLKLRLLYPARLSFRFEGEIKSFTDKQKLREFSNTKPAL